MENKEKKKQQWIIQNRKSFDPRLNIKDNSVKASDGGFYSKIVFKVNTKEYV